MSTLLIKWPKLPWYLVLFAIGTCLGYLTVSRGDIIFLSEHWYVKNDNNVMIFVEHFLIFYAKFEGYQFVFQPDFILSIIGLAIITLQETSVTIKISQTYYLERTHQKKEIFGLAIANLVNGLFGLLPMS